MSTLVCRRVDEKDFHAYSKDWKNKIERKFGSTAGKQFFDVLIDQYTSKDELLNDLEDNNWYDSLIMDRLHGGKSAYINKDFCNTFYHTLKAIINGTDYMSSIKETYKLNNNIFDECIRKELEKIGYNKEDIMRISWRINSFCLIYSRTTKQWCIGKIIKIFINKLNKEWMVVKYGMKIKNIQRFCQYIKPINNDILLNKKISIRNTQLIFHFYGIKSTFNHKSEYEAYYNKYKLSFKNLNKSLLVSISSSLNINDNILSLKNLIRKIYNIDYKNDILIIFGDNIISVNNNLKLRAFGITNNSLLLLAINCDNNIHKNNVADTKHYKISIKTKKGFDIITQESNSELFKMPNCGHYLSKESLYNYAYNELKNGNNSCIKCPHKYDNNQTEFKYNEWDEWSCTYCTFLNDINNNICQMCENIRKPQKMFCESKWNYSLIKQILLYNNNSKNNWFDISKLELLLSRNKLQIECNVQQCPKCNSLYYKNNNDYNINNIKTKYDIQKVFKIECQICKYKNYNNIFCFCCGKPWIYGHICDNSFKLELINILKNAQTKTIGDVSIVPSIRSCPNCAQLITHQEACKHMNCSQCNTDFCFVCLSICVNGNWQCGSSGDVCPIAPRQNINNLPNTIVINKKSFQLF